MRPGTKVFILGLALLATLGGAGYIEQRFSEDMAIRRTRAAMGSTMADTRCGPIEYQEQGLGAPLLMVHGSGGGHDQGMQFAKPFSRQGVRVIAMSRFGYLRTPIPEDASPAAQADAHVCLLDYLGIAKASVLGASAGAPSATQLAIRHPERVNGLILVVPIEYRPPTAPDQRRPSPLAEELLLGVLKSDFVFWSALHLARDPIIEHLLATPPALVHAASAAERKRVDTMMANILPVSLRAEGLRNETVITTHLQPVALDAIRAPTLIISAKDDGYGTCDNAQYLAAHISNARLIGYDTGGHLLIGHSDDLEREILAWIISNGTS